ncbi:hypothetical protein Fmac_031543 [Flemingia macrophylla]|uniref:RING-type E3 ubiquitin transferase n=1 Tax=Flemingia macrophylla TaxID=520843 RepID=A0ABD1L2C4_9FABA
MGIHTECPAPALLFINLHYVHAYSLLLLFLLVPPLATAQSPPPPPLDPFTRLRFDRTMAAVLVVLMVVFFALGFVSIYTRQCAQLRIRGRLDLAVAIAGGMERRQQRGLDAEIVASFPTFVYSEVKALKIGRATLECAVCLNEFGDDETLRLVPKCCHVFHPNCIDAWLINHSTCPVCRANLEEPPPSVNVQAPDSAQPNGPNAEYDPNPVEESQRGSVENRIVTLTLTEPPTPSANNFADSVRSTSTGWLFPRSHSTGRPGEDLERYTLRLPEEVRNRLLSSATLNRTKSCGVTWQRASSGRRGYRTRSLGRNYLPYERLDRFGFMWTPPFWCRTGEVRSPKDVGERSCDRLFSKE